MKYLIEREVDRKSSGVADERSKKEGGKTNVRVHQNGVMEKPGGAAGNQRRWRSVGFEQMLLFGDEKRKGARTTVQAEGEMREKGKVSWGYMGL